MIFNQIKLKQIISCSKIKIQLKLKINKIKIRKMSKMKDKLEAKVLENLKIRKKLLSKVKMAKLSKIITRQD